MRVEIYERPDGDWGHRFVFRNGHRSGHRYRSGTDAKRGADDLINAIRAEGDGIEFIAVPYAHPIPDYRPTPD